MKKNNIHKLFLISIIICFIATVFIGMISYGESLRGFLFIDINDSFMDFFNPILHAYERNPYTRIDVIYPPICYVFYWLLSLFIPTIYFEEYAYSIRASQEGLFVFITYMVVTVIVLFYLIDKLLDISKYRILYITCILLSAPFLYLYERANIIVWALIFIMFFIAYKDSGSKVLRELSYIFLALAFSIKIYPALFGILLLKDKKYFESLRCILYGVFLFFSPFLLMGGFSKIPVMINSLKSGASNTLNIYQGLGYKVNYSNTVSMVFSLFTGRLNESYFIIGSYITYFLLIIFVLFCFIIKEKWKLYALICSVMIGVPGFSFQYTIILMTIPLIVFLNKNDYEYLDYVYMILFVMQFAFCSFAPIGFLERIEGAYPVTVSIFLESLSVLLMPLIIVIEEFIIIMKREKNEKTSFMDNNTVL